MDPLLRTALDAAEAASRVLLRWSGRVGMAGADVKGFGDFVSRADVEAEEAALAVIGKRYPNHRILAEESAPDELAGGADDVTPTWIVDPLDGTKNFLHGHPSYAVSVAVAMGGRPVGGVVVCPATGERWWATRGGGAWKNGCPVRVSEIGSVDRALVGTGFPFKRLDLLSAYVVQFEAMVRAGAAVRRAGAAALDLCYLAEGRFDAFWELVLNPWDFAAGVLVIEEAGGVVCRVDGSSLELTQGPVAAANSRGLLEKMLEILGGTARLYPDL